jgi:glycosyltransferase involved in cell wall biosynthesis
MKIFIDALSAKAGGGITYMQYLPNDLASVDKDNDYLILISKRYQKGLIHDLPSNFHYYQVNIPSKPVVIRLSWEQFILPFILFREHADLLYVVTETACFLSPCPVIIAIRNPNVYADFSQLIGLGNKMKRLIQRLITKLSVRKAAKVIFVSESSMKQAIRKIPVPAPKRMVIYHGFDHSFVFQNSSLPPKLSWLGQKDFILCVSNVSRHKNCPTLIKAYSLLLMQATTEQTPDLVIVGGISDQGAYKSIMHLIHENDLQQRVHLVGTVKHSTLPSIYKAAKLFVLPSLQETFGHPLIEAMASGVPIIASSIPVIQEICQEAALYFDPNNPDELRAKMEHMLSDPELREKLIQKGLERAKQFSWGKCAKQTLAVFKEACEAEGSKP